MSKRTTLWIALFRGVNVGGKNRLPMKQLVSVLEPLGFADVRTYIQSGNVVFQASARSGRAVAALIQGTIQRHFGFTAPVVAIDSGTFESALADNPFPEAQEQFDGKTLHLFFLDKKPTKIDHSGLDAVKRPSERWALVDQVFYLHAPEGFGDSKLAARAEKLLGVSATARNWRSVSAIAALARTT